MQHRPAVRGIMFEPSGVVPPKVARPRVSIHRLTTYEPAAVDRALHAVLAPLGGMSAFVAPGARVVLKPSLLMPSAPERAICTHPEIIRAVARLAREAGAALVEATDSLVVQYAREKGARVLVRGVRSVPDFSYEFDLSIMNKALDTGIETFFLPTDPKYFVLRSSAIKEMAAFKGDLSNMVPPAVEKAVRRKMG